MQPCSHESAPCRPGVFPEDRTRGRGLAAVLCMEMAKGRVGAGLDFCGGRVRVRHGGHMGARPGSVHGGRVGARRGGCVGARPGSLRGAELSRAPPPSKSTPPPVMATTCPQVWWCLASHEGWHVCGPCHPVHPGPPPAARTVASPRSCCGWRRHGRLTWETSGSREKREPQGGSPRWLPGAGAGAAAWRARGPCSGLRRTPPRGSQPVVPWAF